MGRAQTRPIASPLDRKPSRCPPLLIEPRTRGQAVVKLGVVGGGPRQGPAPEPVTAVAGRGGLFYSFLRDKTKGPHAPPSEEMAPR